jgi:hypothetical protein
MKGIAKIARSAKHCQKLTGVLRRVLEILHIPFFLILALRCDRAAGNNE